MNKLVLVPTNQFKRDARKQFQMLLTAEWTEVLYYLINDKELPEKYCDHSLTGDFKDYRECHIRPDLLLVYAKRGNELHLARLGTHSELFG